MTSRPDRKSGRNFYALPEMSREFYTACVLMSCIRILIPKQSLKIQLLRLPFQFSNLTDQNHLT